MEKARDYRLDLIKFIACCLIVVLHGMRPGDGLQEFFYLVGSYGVPLFFLVNGYLRSGKALDWGVLGRSALRFAIFILLWSLIVTVVQLLLGGDFAFFSLLYGAVVGKGRLLHLWFLSGLLAIYAVCALLTSLLGDARLKALLAKPAALSVTVLLMTLSFCANLLLKRRMGIEIKELIPAPLRLVTNGGFFVLGLHRGLNRDRGLRIDARLLLPLAALSTLVLWLAARRTDILWASSYYPSLPVILCCLLMLDSLSVKPSLLESHAVRAVLLTSGGVWILHPFVISFLDKLLALLQIEKTVWVLLAKVFAALLICVPVTLLLQKNKFLRRLVEP